MKRRTVFVGSVVVVAIGFAGAGLKLFVDSFVMYAEDVPWANGYHLLARSEEGAELPPSGTLVFMAASVIGVVTDERPPDPKTVALQLRQDVVIPADSRFYAREIGDKPAIVVVPGTLGRYRPWEEVRIERAAERVTPPD